MNTTQARRGLVGALAFMLPFLSLVTLWGVSLSSFLFLLAALLWFKPCRAALAQHWIAVRWVLGAFLIYFLFAALCLVLRPGAGSGDIEKPVRMLFAMSALALVMAFRPRRSALWWGVIGGAVGGALLVGFQRLALGMDRPGGLLNAITAERPLLGRSLPEARREMARRVAQGTLDPVVLPAVHFHHDVLHMLVTGGVAGLFAWLSILAAPLIFLCAACALAMASAWRLRWPACWW